MSALLLSKARALVGVAIAVSAVLMIGCSDDGGGSNPILPDGEAWTTCEGYSCYGFIFNDDGTLIYVGQSDIFGDAWTVVLGVTGTWTKSGDFTLTVSGQTARGTYKRSGDKLTMTAANKMTLTRTKNVVVFNGSGSNIGDGASSGLILGAGEGWNLSGAGVFVFRDDGYAVVVANWGGLQLGMVFGTWSTSGNILTIRNLNGDVLTEDSFSISGNTLTAPGLGGSQTLSRVSGISLGKRAVTSPILDGLLKLFE